MAKNRTWYIAMDTHGQTTDICVQAEGRAGRQQTQHFRVPTSIPHLRGVIENVPEPRKLTFEEGPLADWLWRNLSPHVAECLVCDPRRNALIAKDGDKDDAIDAKKLCGLFIGGYLRPVHHPASLARQLAKQTVGLYHRSVQTRVARANEIIGHLKCWGIVIREGAFSRADGFKTLALRLAEAVRSCQPGPEAEDLVLQAQRHLELLGQAYQEACLQERRLSLAVERLARQDEQAVRFMEVPAIGPVRAMTLLVYLDTPWRFKSKQALWKYLGIGLVRSRSGQGPVVVRVENGVNKRLKNAVMGAALGVLRQGVEPFKSRYDELVQAGVSPRNARRTIARLLAGMLWGMWKSGDAYAPERVLGQAQACRGTGRRSAAAFG